MGTRVNTAPLLAAEIPPRRQAIRRYRNYAASAGVKFISPTPVAQGWTAS